MLFMALTLVAVVVYWLNLRGPLWIDYAALIAIGVAGEVAAARARGFHPRTLGGDKNYDTRVRVAEQRERGVTPHVAQNSGRKGGSAIDGRTTRHPGYAISQRIRKRVEEIFGWFKTIGGFRRTRCRGVDRTGLLGYLVATAYTLVRLSRLVAGEEREAIAS